MREMQMSDNLPRGHASVMPRRESAPEALDLFPTPPFCTRTLCEWLSGHVPTHEMDAWDPCAGLGHMARPMREYFASVYSTDIYDYGHNDATIDFLQAPLEWRRDAILMNPPFNRAEDFIKRAWAASPVVGVLVRTSFLEGQRRFTNLFSYRPPTYILQHVERIPMHKGRLLKNGSTATAYCWLVYLPNAEHSGTKFDWLPAARKRLEKPEDYD